MLPLEKTHPIHPLEVVTINRISMFLVPHKADPHRLRIPMQVLPFLPLDVLPEIVYSLHRRQPIDKVHALRAGGGAGAALRLQVVVPSQAYADCTYAGGFRGDTGHVYTDCGGGVPACTF